jgi:hypothetical protein
MTILRLAEGGRRNPDEILENAKGQGFTSLLILADTPDGIIQIASNLDVGAALLLMERAKDQIVWGEG